MTIPTNTSSAHSLGTAKPGTAVAGLSAAHTPARTYTTRGEAWRAVCQAIANAAREIFSSAEYHVDFRTRSERFDGGGYEHIRVIVSEVGAAKVLGAALPWTRKHPFLEISLEASDSGLRPMNVGALKFRTTNPDGKPVADLIAARAPELIADLGLQRLAPVGEARFEVVRRVYSDKLWFLAQ